MSKTVAKETTYKGFWKYMYKYVKQYKKELTITMICTLIVGICVSVQPLVIKWIVDDGISNNLLNNTEKMQFIISLCLFYVILTVSRVYIYRFALAHMLKALEGAIFNLRSRFFSHIQSMCMNFHDKTSVGELFNYIMGSPMTNIKTYMQQMFINVPHQIMSLIISICALSSFDFFLTLILVLIALTMAVTSYFSRKKIRTVFKDYIQAENEASHYLNDTLHGMDAIKMYSIEENSFNEFRKFIDNMYQKGVKANVEHTHENQKPELIIYIGQAILYLVGAFSCIYRGMSVGTLYAFLSSMGIILTKLSACFGVTLQKGSAEASLHKILRILDMNSTTPETIKGTAKNVDLEKDNAQYNQKPCISFENVKFGYDNRCVFENLNCSIKYGESIALVGGSGSGKSTFTKLIMRLYDINSGTIKVHGCDVKDYFLHDLRVSFGVVPQNPFIFHGSIWDNILIARPQASNREIIQAMEIAHVHDFVNELEHGWNTIVGDGALGLSGGQKQRIAIARAVLGNPDILIFDEATSALDNISEHHIQQAMEELMKTHTVIIVAHRLSTIKNVDRILVFDKGEIVQEGNYEELSQKDGIFKNLLNA